MGYKNNTKYFEVIDDKKKKCGNFSKCGNFIHDLREDYCKNCR